MQVVHLVPLDRKDQLAELLDLLVPLEQQVLVRLVPRASEVQAELV